MRRSSLKENTWDSEHETVNSTKGYDTKDATNDDQDMSDNDTDQNDLDTYDVEYEPEGLSSDEEQTAHANGRKGKKQSKDDDSDIDSEIDEALILAVTYLEQLKKDH